MEWGVVIDRFQRRWDIALLSRQSNFRRMKNKWRVNFLGDRGDEVIVMSVVYTSGLVSVLYLDYFSSLYSSYKPSHSSLTLSL